MSTELVTTNIVLLTEVAQEALIALRERAVLLQMEIQNNRSSLSSGFGGSSEIIREIAQRQLIRVQAAGHAIAGSIGERF